MSEVAEIQVVKRDGSIEDVQFDKILTRIRNVAINTQIGENLTIPLTALAMKVIEKLYDKITTTAIDNFTASICESMSTIHPDYYTLAGRIIHSNHQKNTLYSFYETTKLLYEVRNNKGESMLNEEYYAFVCKYSVELDEMIDYKRDYLINYFGFKTLETSYLLKIGDKRVERIQHLWMRVSTAIHCFGKYNTDTVKLQRIKETYDLMSTKHFVHATPTLFNAGLCRQQLSSCYLKAMEDDSIEGIYDTLKDCALISKYSGGIGLHISNIRSNKSAIHSTNGKSNGICPMLRVFNETAKYVDQGGGKRNGSFAIYLEPWHADVMDFLELKRNKGASETKSRDLQYAIWMPDLFMKRIQANEKWSLFCPNTAMGLQDVYGEEFETLYAKYEREELYVRQLPAREVWMAILSAQMETGVPYILFKDACNRKSNQKNLGTIKSSNLCTEIIEYSSKDETAVCNLASICLPTFVKEEDKTFDYKKLYNVVKVITRNLNNVIDITYYPTSTSIRSNMRHRPIGLGVQGLADAYLLMDLAYTSNEAKEMNKLIFETIYYASLETSYEISKERYDVIYNDVIQQFGEFTKETLNKVVVKSGRCWDDDEIWETRSNTKPISKYDLYWNESRQGLNNPKWIGAYSSFDGSPTSKGVLQFDMWDNYTPVSNRYDWTSLKNNIQEYGIRNSLLVAPMPTVSTSQIMGFNESFEPYSSNMYTKNTLTGNYIITNQHLIKELIQMGQWNEKMKNNIIANNGSVAQLTHLPETFREKYRTVWEISMEDMINMSADRAPFICHSQSLNYYVEEPNVAQLTRLFMLAYTRGLKTGMYYLRRKAKHQAQQFTVEPINENDGEESETQVCEMCSA